MLGQWTTTAFKVTRREVVENQGTLVQVLFRQPLLYPLLTFHQPIHGRVEFVLIRVPHPQFLSQGDPPTSPQPNPERSPAWTTAARPAATTSAAARSRSDANPWPPAAVPAHSAATLPAPPPHGRGAACVQSRTRPPAARLRFRPGAACRPSTRWSGQWERLATVRLRTLPS